MDSKSQVKARLAVKRRDGSVLYYIVDLSFPDGRRQRISLGTDDPKQAKSLFSKWKVEVLPGILRTYEQEKNATHSTDLPLSKLIDYYLDNYLVVRGASQKTRDGHRQKLRDFELYCRDRRVGRVSQISRNIVDAHAAELMARGRAPKTVHNHLTALRACLNAGIEAGMLERSPIKKWLFPKLDEGEIEPLTPDQLRQVLDIVRDGCPRIFNIVRWIAFTGNRPSDARDLRWRQVDLTTRTVERPQIKTGRLAHYQVGDEALASLVAEQERNRPGPDGEVFTNQHGEPFGKNAVYRAFTRTIMQSGFARDVSLKDLRHTFGYLMANHCGCPLPVLQVLMGHREINMTMRYVRPGDAFEYIQNLGSLVGGKQSKARRGKSG